MSLRLRLALLVSALVSAVLLGLGVYVHATLDDWSAEVLDGELHRRADRVEAAIEVEHGEGHSWEVELEEHDDAIAHFRVTSAAGEALFSRGFEPLESAEGWARPGYHTVVSADGQRWRVFVRQLELRDVRAVRHLPRDRRPVQVAVAARAERFEAVSLRFRGGLAGALVLGGLLGAIGAALVAQRLSAPLRRLSAEVAAIDARGLGRRVTTEGLDAELASLAAALNDTLARLELAFGQQGGFVARASHALRTPIAAMLAEAEVALRRPRTAEELRASLEEIVTVARDAAAMSEQLLALARADAGVAAPRREPVALAELVERLRRALEPRLEAAGLRACVDVPAELRVSAEPARLAELLDALLDNAVRYTPRGGELGVVARAVDGGARVALEVWDSGLGIDEAERTAVFARFTRGRAAAESGQPGSGLGLAMVEAIARAHGAQVQLAPRPGGGTRVLLDWPAGADPDRAA